MTIAPDLFGTSAEDIVAEAREIVPRAQRRFCPVKTFALFSGGNDSTTMLHLVRDQVDAAVHIDTGIGVPETAEHVRWVCSAWDVPLIELRTDPAVYRDIVLGPSRKGFPGPAFHYITYHRLKSQRLQELQRDHAGRGERILLVSGVRAHESERRMRQVGGHEMESPRGRLGKCCWANPIVHFTSEAMNAYRAEHDVPRNPVADLLHKSGECLCGAFARPGELDEIALWFPETAAYIRDLEAQALTLGKPYPRWGASRAGSRRAAIPGPLCSSCKLFEQDAPTGAGGGKDSATADHA